jgi:DHA1 family bicyclomycin/chloramphenicol resistance-like MFS transporter
VTTVVHPGDSLSRRQRVVYVLVLGALTALGPFTVDLYLPSFPAIERDLDTSVAAIQLTLTATTIGFALGQLLVGPWSDKIGRRTPLIVATAVHILSSLAIIFAPSVEWVGALRVLQGIGAAGGGVVAVAMVRDLFGGLPLVRMMSRLALVSGLAPVFAPVIGSQLLLFTDWRGIFAFLTIYGAVVIAAAFFLLVETQPAARRGDRGHSTARERYRSLFTDRIFVGAIIVAGMTFSGLFGYLSSSSFLFQEIYDFSPQQFGLLFGVNSIGIIIGVQTSSRLAKLIGPQWILLGAVTSMFLAATTIVTLELLDVGLLGILIPLWFFILSCGFAFPMQQVLAIDGHGGEAATAASLMGAVNFGLAGLLSPIIGVFGIHNAIPMAAMMMCTSTVSLLVVGFVIRPKTVPALSR